MDFDFKKFWNIGQSMSDEFYYKNKKLFIFLRISLVIMLVLLGLLIFKSCTNANALSGSTFTCYDNLYYNDSYASRLVSFVPNKQKLVIARVDEYSYVVFYSDDISYSNNKFVGTDVNYIEYYRTNSSYTSTWQYRKGNISSLVLNTNNMVVTSNVDGYDFVSRSYSYEDRQDTINILHLVMVFLPIILFANLWGVIKRDVI